MMTQRVLIDWMSQMAFNIDYLSDLHIDHHLGDASNYTKVHNFIATYVLPLEFTTKRPILVLAGDIFDKSTSAFNVFKAFKEFYEEVIYVYGNHECYVYDKNMVSTEEKLGYIREAATANGIHMLEGTSITLNGISFGGGSAWYDFSYGYKYGEDFGSMYNLWKSYMSDSHLVADYMIAPIAYARSRTNVLDFERFLGDRMQQVRNIPENTDVVVTHISPSVPPTLPDEYKNETTGFYFFDGEKEIERINPKVWIFGHTHNVYNFKVNNTTLLCNPFGYQGERGKRLNKLDTRISTYTIEKE